MSEQIDLFSPKPMARAEHPLTLEAKFQAFHEENPDVYDHLVRLAHQAKRRGHQKIGIGLLWEVMRWERSMQTIDPEGFKLNNNWRSRYARMIMQREPALEGFFELRELQTE